MMLIAIRIGTIHRMNIMLVSSLHIWFGLHDWIHCRNGMDQWCLIDVRSIVSCRPVLFRLLVSPLPPYRSRSLSAASSSDVQLHEIADSVSVILRALGEDPSRPGLQQTPMRAAKALAYFTKGYETNLESRTNNEAPNRQIDERGDKRTDTFNCMMMHELTCLTFLCFLVCLYSYCEWCYLRRRL